MKNLLFISALALLLSFVSCKNNSSSLSLKSNNADQEETIQLNLSEDLVDLLTKADSESSQARKPVKKPVFRKKDVKKALEYELLLDGRNEETIDLKIGHFEIDDATLECYATLAQNGLISITTKAIKCDGGNSYSTWADVALTSTGKKYVSKNNAENEVLGLDKLKYKSILKPARDRNAYGELEEEIVQNPEINQLITDFYAEYANRPTNAIKVYGEEEFAETCERVNKIDSYMKILAVGSIVPDNCFYGGTAFDGLAPQPTKVFKITKYVDCYRVYFDNGSSVALILTPDGTHLFDVVIDEKEGKTIRTANASWTEDNIKLYAEMASAPATELTTEEDLGIERVWNAPGLVLVGENNKERYIYPVEKDNAIDQYVTIVLYRTVIDRIYNVKIITEEAEDDPGNDYTFTASANVVFKRVNISPFQYILQSFNIVEKLTNDSIYEKENFMFGCFDDGHWGVIDLY